MESVTTSPATSAEVAGLMAQMNLQTNGSTPSATTRDSTMPISPTANNNSASRQRTGIPRYAIPYRRPDDKPASTHTNSSVPSPIASPPASECPVVIDKPVALVSGIPRGRNGNRTESFGDASTSSSGFGVGAYSQRGARAASVGEWKANLSSVLMKSC